MKKFFCVLCGICLFYMGYAQEKEVKAVIETNLGNMIVKLYNDTPNHRDNFVRLAKAGHYDGSLFYRVIKNFVIQGGSSDSKKAIKGAATMSPRTRIPPKMTPTPSSQIVRRALLPTP